MERKKWLLAIAVIGGLCILGTPVFSSGGQEPEKVEIRCYWWGDGEAPGMAGWMKESTELYHQQNPNVTVEAPEIPIEDLFTTWKAELIRIRGELLWQQGASGAEIEACFERAVKIAREQQARLQQLRAAIILCRLWQAQGKEAVAAQMLAEIYDEFSEGFDTADLSEAGQLLEGLSAPETVKV